MNERTPITIDDLYQLGWLEDPRFSPDGRQVAFVRVSVDRAGNCYRHAIWLARADGGAARRFTARAKSDTAPRPWPVSRHRAAVAAGWPVDSHHRQARPRGRLDLRLLRSAARARAGRGPWPGHAADRGRLLVLRSRAIAGWPSARAAAAAG